MDTIIVGRASKFRSRRGELEILDPDGRTVGRIAFLNAESVAKFASAARIVESVTRDSEAEPFCGYVQQFDPEHAA